MVLRLCCRNRPEGECSLTLSALSNANRLGRTALGEAVEEGGADVEFGCLAVRSLGRELLAQKLEAPHPGFDETSLVVAAPGASDGSAEAEGGAQDFVADLGAWCGLLPAASVAPGRDHGRGPNTGCPFEELAYTCAGAYLYWHSPHESAKTWSFP